MILIVEDIFGHFSGLIISIEVTFSIQAGHYWVILKSKEKYWHFRAVVDGGGIVQSFIEKLTVQEWVIC